MERVYRVLLVAVCAVGILFGLQYFLPITAQYLNIPGVAGIPGLPSMPTVAYKATTAPLPLITLVVTPSTPEASSFLLFTATPVPGGTASNTPSLTPDGTAPLASATTTFTQVPEVTSILITATTRPGVTALPTFTPIPIPSATLNPGGACNNVLYPVKKGQGWLYQVSAQGQSSLINMVVADVSGQHGTVSITNQSTGRTSQAAVECDNGIIRSFPAIVSGLLLNNVTSGSLNVQYSSGILAPSRANFESANWNLTWTGYYSLSGSAVVPFQGNNVNLVLNSSPMTLICRTAGSGEAAFENITVAAGSYHALKVTCIAQSLVTGTINGNSINGTVSGSSTQWFGLDTGLLRLRVDSASFNFMGISLPQNLDGQVELLHFQPTP